jgi:FKBP-type peptidyl-prolyl cis-trans isomerase
LIHLNTRLEDTVSIVDIIRRIVETGQSTMQLKYTLFLATGLLAGSALAYTVVQPDRRTMLKQSMASAMAFVPGVGILTVRGGAASAADDTTGSADADGFITTESGLRYKVLKEGTGAIPQAGQTVKTHYTGT